MHFSKYQNVKFGTPVFGLVLLICMVSVLIECGEDEVAVVVPPSGPEVTSLTPNRGPVGTVVRIRGSGFSETESENRMTFADTEADVVSSSTTEIQAVVPGGAETGSVKVTVDEETAIGPVFTIEAMIPGIAELVPDSGVVGAEVTIRGANLGTDPEEITITFNGIAAPVLAAEDSLLITEVPEGATTGPIEVTVGEESTTGPIFTVITTGSIEVIVETTGSEQDPDGYTLLFNEGDESRSLEVNDTAEFTNIGAGTYELELTDVAANCGVEGDNPRTADVTAGEKTTVEFEVVCTEKTGSLEVIVETTGSDIDPDGYTVTVDGSDTRDADVNDVLLFEDLGEGDHEAELTGMADNCAVEGENPRTVDIEAGETSSTEFEVVCSEILNDQIVFYSDREGNEDIFVMDIDGSNQANLTNHGSSDTDPAISPDGTQVAFASDRDGNREIYVMDADGSNVTQLTFTSAITNSQPAWSPSGDKIAFTRFTGTQNFEIFVINSDGSGETNLTNHAADDIQPDWSPDGDEIAFVSDRDGENEIYVMNSDGSSVTQLTDNTTGDESPAWSPDGTQIAYRDESFQSPNIFIVDSDGSNATELTNNFDTDDLPAWSPDGIRIVFQSDRDGNEEIYSIETDGSGLMNLSKNSSDDEHPHWSPLE